MKQLSFNYIATQSVDYLGQIHNWTDTDIISFYKEICKQLVTCQEKLREEREPKGQKKPKKLSQNTAQQSQRSQQSQRGENNNAFTIGNFSNKLKLQIEESALHAEE